MTTPYREQITCGRCGHRTTTETAFNRWIRNNHRLDAVREGLVVFDIDILLHRYKVMVEDGKGTRDIQCMMFVEVKTHGARMTAAQEDTLFQFNQILRNRVSNRHSKAAPQVSQCQRKVRSMMLQKEVTIKLYGGHCLRFSGSSPDDSEEITWGSWDFGHDNYGKQRWKIKETKINKQQLEEILLFERDPDRPRLKIDHRRRSCSWSDKPRLPGF